MHVFKHRQFIYWKKVASKWKPIFFQNNEDESSISEAGQASFKRQAFPIPFVVNSPFLASLSLFQRNEKSEAWSFKNLGKEQYIYSFKGWGSKTGKVPVFIDNWRSGSIRKVSLRSDKKRKEFLLTGSSKSSNLTSSYLGYAVLQKEAPKLARKEQPVHLFKSSKGFETTEKAAKISSIFFQKIGSPVLKPLSFFKKLPPVQKNFFQNPLSGNKAHWLLPFIGFIWGQNLLVSNETNTLWSKSSEKQSTLILAPSNQIFGKDYSKNIERSTSNFLSLKKVKNSIKSSDLTRLNFSGYAQNFSKSFLVKNQFSDSSFVRNLLFRSGQKNYWYNIQSNPKNIQRLQNGTLKPTAIFNFPNNVFSEVIGVSKNKNNGRFQSQIFTSDKQKSSKVLPLRLKLLENRFEDMYLNLDEFPLKTSGNNYRSLASLPISLHGRDMKKVLQYPRFFEFNLDEPIQSYQKASLIVDNIRNKMYFESGENLPFPDFSYSFSNKKKQSLFLQRATKLLKNPMPINKINTELFHCSIQNLNLPLDLKQKMKELFFLRHIKNLNLGNKFKLKNESGIYDFDQKSEFYNPFSMYSHSLASVPISLPFCMPGSYFNIPLLTTKEFGKKGYDRAWNDLIWNGKKEPEEKGVCLEKEGVLLRKAHESIALQASHLISAAVANLKNSNLPFPERGFYPLPFREGLLRIRSIAGASFAPPLLGCEACEATQKGVQPIIFDYPNLDKIAKFKTPFILSGYQFPELSLKATLFYANGMANSSIYPLTSQNENTDLPSHLYSSENSKYSKLLSKKQNYLFSDRQKLGYSEFKVFRNKNRNLPSLLSLSKETSPYDFRGKNEKSNFSFKSNTLLSFKHVCISKKHSFKWLLPSPLLRKPPSYPSMGVRVQGGVAPHKKHACEATRFLDKLNRTNKFELFPPVSKEFVVSVKLDFSTLSRVKKKQLAFNFKTFKNDILKSKRVFYKPTQVSKFSFFVHSQKKFLKEKVDYFTNMNFFSNPFNNSFLYPYFYQSTSLTGVNLPPYNVCLKSLFRPALNSSSLSSSLISSLSEKRKENFGSSSIKFQVFLNKYFQWLKFKFAKIAKTKDIKYLDIPLVLNRNSKELGYLKLFQKRKVEKLFRAYLSNKFSKKSMFRNSQKKQSKKLTVFKKEVSLTYPPYSIIKLSEKMSLDRIRSLIKQRKMASKAYGFRTRAQRIKRGKDTNGSLKCFEKIGFETNIINKGQSNFEFLFFGPNSERNILKIFKRNPKITPQSYLKKRVFLFLSRSKVEKWTKDIKTKEILVQLSKQKNTQKKHRRKKQKRQTRRKTKRKRIYPRPVWLRFPIYQKFLKIRHGENKTNQGKTLINAAVANLNFSNLPFPSLKGRGINGQLIKNNNIISQTGLSNPKVKKAVANRRFANSFFTLKIREKMLKTRIYRANKQKWGSCQLDYPRFEKVRLRSENYFKSLPFFENKSFYQIPNNVYNDLNKLSLKSYWLRSHLEPYLKRVRNSLDSMKFSSQKNYLNLVLPSFLNEFIGKFVYKRQNTQIMGLQDKHSIQNSVSHFYFENTQKAFLAVKKERPSSYVNGIKAGLSLHSVFNYQALKSAEYKKTLQKRIRYEIRNMKENVSLGGQLKARCFKAGRSKKVYSEKITSFRNFWNTIGETWAPLISENPLKNSVVFFLPTEAGKGTEINSEKKQKSRIYWSLNKTNLFGFRETNSLKNLISSYKRREQKKSNPTKKLIWSRISPILNGGQSSRRPCVASPKGGSYARVATPLLSRGGSKLKGRVQKLKAQTRLYSLFQRKFQKFEERALVLGITTPYQTQSLTKLSNRSFKPLKNQIGLKRKGNSRKYNQIAQIQKYRRNHPKRSVNFWWSKKSLNINQSIAPLWSQTLMDVKFNSYSLNFDSKKDMSFFKTNPAFPIGFFSFTVCCIFIHLTLFFSLLYIPEVRSFLKFQGLIVYKLSNSYITLVQLLSNWVYRIFFSLKKQMSSRFMFSLYSNLYQTSPGDKNFNENLKTLDFQAVTNLKLESFETFSNFSLLSPFLEESFRDNLQSQKIEYTFKYFSFSSLSHFWTIGLSPLINRWVFRSVYKKSFLKKWVATRPCFLPLQGMERVAPLPERGACYAQQPVPRRGWGAKQPFGVGVWNGLLCVASAPFGERSNPGGKPYFHIKKISKKPFEAYLRFYIHKKIKMPQTFSLNLKKRVFLMGKTSHSKEILFVGSNPFLHHSWSQNMGIKATKEVIGFYLPQLFFKAIDLIETLLVGTGYIWGQSIFKFLEKPTKLIIAWIAEVFLLEWSSDLLVYIPDSFDLAVWCSFSKLSRGLKGSSLISGYPFLGFLYQKRVLSSMQLFLQTLLKPDTDLLMRQKQGILFWDIWADILIRAAEEYDINIPSLTTLKEERDLLLEKLLENEGNVFSAGLSSQIIKLSSKASSGNKSSKFLDQNSQLQNISPLLESLQMTKPNGLDFIFSRRKIKSLSLNSQISNWWTPFQINLNSLSLTNFSLSTKKLEPEVKTIANQIDKKSIYPILSHLSSKAFSRRQFKGVRKGYFMSFLERGNSDWEKQKQTKWQRWSINQSFSYEGQETDLFLDIHPPKSFRHFYIFKRSVPNADLQPVAQIVCQIYSGILIKQISKNLLVVGAPGSGKSLLIGAIAGETELQMISDHSQKYATVSRGIAVGMKLLREVFNALALHAPCLFLMEEIHLIGERRPLLISDDENAKAAESGGSASLGFEREEVHEKNQVIYQLNKHAISHYRKPYKGDFSLLIQTNHFCFDLFLGVNKEKKRRSKPISPLPIAFLENEIQNDNEKLNTSKDSTDRNHLSSNSFTISQLQLKSEKGFSPPATSPFTVFLLKEQKKLKPRKIVKQIPWGRIGSSADSTQGKDGESHAKPNYSVRAKVSLLADLAISNLSAKLDRITDLLVIMDSVRSQRGFVVFATTHIPFVLDPALRRPGRLDETVSLPSLPNIINRFEILKTRFSAKEQRSKTFDFINYSTLLENLNETRIDRLIYGQKLLLFTLPNTKLVSKLAFTGLREEKDSYLFSPLVTMSALETNQRQKSQSKVFAKHIQNWNGDLPELYWSRFSNKTKEGKDSFLKQNENSLANKNDVYRATSYGYYKKEKKSTGVSSEILGSIYPNRLATQQILRYKTPSNIRSTAYFQMGKFLINSLIFTRDKKVHSSLGKSISSMHLWPEGISNTFSKVSDRDYLDKNNGTMFKNLYSSSSDLKNQIIQLLSGKIGEFFAYDGGRAYTKQFSDNISPGIDIDKLSFLPLPYNGLWSLDGIDNLWRSAHSMILSIFQKRYFYQKNSLVFQLLDIQNSQSLKDGGPMNWGQGAVIFSHAKRFENFKRTEKDFQKKSTLKIYEKLEFHQRQKRIKELYLISSAVTNLKNSNLPKIIENYPNAKKNQNSIPSGSAIHKISLSLSELEHNKSAGIIQPSSIQTYYRNRVLFRHRFYLTNLWWNGHLAEHNREATFSSDVDWRYLFVKNVGDILIDFPDADQHYNPRNRRWMNSNGYWGDWYMLEKIGYREIYSHFALECFNEAYKILDQNREILDYLAYQFLINGAPKSIDLVSILSWAKAKNRNF